MNHKHTTVLKDIDGKYEYCLTCGLKWSLGNPQGPGEEKCVVCGGAAQPGKTRCAYHDVWNTLRQEEARP